MLSDKLLKTQKTFETTDLQDVLPLLFKGKVRDIYELENDKLLIAVSDRISAFDKILGTVPFKGQVLGGIANWWFKQVKTLTDTHLLVSPHSAVSVVKKCTPLPVEIIVRGYLTGNSPTSIWTAYKNGIRKYCGHNLPENLKKDRPLPKPLVTPTTKADLGQHDELISAQEIIHSGLVAEETYLQLEKIALKLYEKGVNEAQKRGLILADTKYEFGIDSAGKVILIDEIHTPDSSRYWYADDYEELVSQGKSPRGLDKDFVRNYLISVGYKGEGAPPSLPEEVVFTAAKNYVKLYELITGEKFEPEASTIKEAVEKYLKINS